MYYLIMQSFQINAFLLFSPIRHFMSSSATARYCVKHMYCNAEETVLAHCKHATVFRGALIENRASDLLVLGTMLNQLSHTGQGSYYSLDTIVYSLFI